jgi:hypothetical protein
LGGQLPSGLQFLATSLELYVLPGSSSAASTYLPSNPGQFAVDDTVAGVASVNDVNTLSQAGQVTFTVLDKVLVDEFNIGSFPPKNFITIDAAVSDISATTPGQTTVVTARPDGVTYVLQPYVTLTPNTNFNVSINFPGLVATPSTFNARIICVLDGYAMRATQ